MGILADAYAGIYSRDVLNGASIGLSLTDGLFAVNGVAKNTVSPKKALTVAAVYNAVELISNSMGNVPYGVYRKIQAGRERLYDHPVDQLLNVAPSGPDGYLTPFRFRALSETSCLLRGNALWFILDDAAGRVKLKFCPWDHVIDIFEKDFKLVYHTRYGDFLHNEVLHYKDVSLDGRVGISRISYAALHLGLAVELQQYSYSTYESKGVRHGVITTDKQLGNKDVPAKSVKEKIIAGWRNAMSERSADRVAVLDDGFKYQSINITPQEAQLIEMGRFSVEDIARFFNVPVHKLKSMQQSTNNNIEMQASEYLSDTIQPRVAEREQENTLKLISDKERNATLKVEGNMEVLYRSDLKTRSDWASQMVNNGIMTPNEVRAKKNLNFLPGGDELRIPVNTTTQSQIDNNVQP